MLSAQPTNVWTLKNCKFRAWALTDASRPIAFQTADTSGDNIHPIGNVVRTDSDGFVYGENNMQLPNGCFVAEEAIIEASRDNGLSYPISWVVRNQNPLTRVKASDGITDLLNTNEGGLWGENLGRNDGKVRFTDIVGSVDITQVPKLGIEQLSANSVGVDQIKDDSVTHPKLADDAVEENNIKDGSVTHPKLADDAVEANNIAKGAVTLESLSGSIGSLLRFRVANTMFSSNPNLPTKISKDDFIIILPTQDYLRLKHISTEDMEKNTFVLLVPAYHSPDPDELSGTSTIWIDRIPYVSEVDERANSDIQNRFGFIIFKPETGNVRVCRYLANGNWNMQGGT